MDYLKEKRSLPSNAATSTIGWSSSPLTSNAVHRSVSVSSQPGTSIHTSSHHLRPMDAAIDLDSLAHLNSKLSPKMSNASSSLPLQKAQGVRSEGPPLVPRMVARYTSFSCIPGLELATVVECVSKALTLEDVDVTCNPEKFKWKTTCYPKNELLCMTIQLYFDEKKDGHYVLETRRDVGNMYSFNKLNRRLVAQLRLFSVLDDADRNVMRMNKTRRAYHASSSHAQRDMNSTCTTKIDISSLLPLLGMCTSDFEDLRIEASRELANQTGTKEARRLMASSSCKFLDQFVAMLKSTVEPVRRCAAVAIEHFARDTDTVGALPCGVVEALVSLGTQKTSSAETKRHVVCALTFLGVGSKEMKDAIVTAGGVDMMQLCAAYPNPRLKKCVQDAKDALAL